MKLNERHIQRSAIRRWVAALYADVGARDEDEERLEEAEAGPLLEAEGPAAESADDRSTVALGASSSIGSTSERGPGSTSSEAAATSAPVAHIHLGAAAAPGPPLSSAEDLAILEALQRERMTGESVLSLVQPAHPPLHPLPRRGSVGPAPAPLGSVRELRGDGLDVPPADSPAGSASSAAAAAVPGAAFASPPHTRSATASMRSGPGFFPGPYLTGDVAAAAAAGMVPRSPSAAQLRVRRGSSVVGSQLVDQMGPRMAGAGPASGLPTAEELLLNLQQQAGSGRGSSRGAREDADASRLASRRPSSAGARRSSIVVAADAAGATAALFRPRGSVSESSSSSSQGSRRGSFVGPTANAGAAPRSLRRPSTAGMSLPAPMPVRASASPTPSRGKIISSKSPAAARSKPTASHPNQQAASPAQAPAQRRFSTEAQAAPSGAGTDLPVSGGDGGDILGQLALEDAAFLNG